MSKDLTKTVPSKATRVEEGSSDQDTESNTEPINVSEEATISAICVLRAFEPEGYPVVGWFWWCIALFIMLLQGWIFYFAALWAFESFLDENNHDHSVKLPDGTVLQTTQLQDFSWHQGRDTKRYEELFKRLYENYQKNGSIPNITWNEPDFDIDTFCKTSQHVGWSYGREATLMLVFYGFCIIYIMQSFLTNISHGVEMENDYNDPNRKCNGITAKNILGEFFCVILIMVEGFQLLMINTMLYQTLWSTNGLDIVFNAFAILFIVDIDEDFVKALLPVMVVEDVKNYYKNCKTPNWYLDTNTLDKEVYPSIFHNKKIFGKSFSHQSILKIMLITCFIVILAFGLIPIQSDLRSENCYHNLYINYFKSGEMSDEDYARCDYLSIKADSSYDWTDKVAEGFLFFLFAFSSNLFQHICCCQTIYKDDANKINLKKDPSAKKKAEKSKCLKKSTQLVIYVVYVLVSLQFQSGLGTWKTYSVKEYFINRAKESGNIKYGTWMLPGDLYENEKNSWPNKFENLMLWNYNHTHTLSKDYTCDI